MQHLHHHHPTDPILELANAIKQEPLSHTDSSEGCASDGGDSLNNGSDTEFIPDTADQEYRDQLDAEEEGRASHLERSLQLADDITVNYSGNASAKKKRQPRCLLNVKRLTERHFPSHIPPTEKKQEPTRRCVVCYMKRDSNGKGIRKETRIWCEPPNLVSKWPVSKASIVRSTSPAWCPYVSKRARGPFLQAARGNHPVPEQEQNNQSLGILRTGPVLGCTIPLHGLGMRQARYQDAEREEQKELLERLHSSPQCLQKGPEVEDEAEASGCKHCTDYTSCIDHTNHTAHPFFRDS